LFGENLASILILSSGLAHAIVNAILKAGKDKMSTRALIDGFSALLLLPAAFFVPLPAHAWGWLFASALVHGLYLLALIKSFEQADMTVAYPIARGLAPMLAAAAAVAIFHEPIDDWVLSGILLIAIGVMFIGVSHKLRGSALLWAILTGTCIAGYTVIDAQGVRAAPTAMSYIVWTFLLLGGALGSIFAAWRGKAFLASAAGQWKISLIAGTLSIITYGFALFAFRLGATPRLAALRETSILFGTAIAVIFLKERLDKRRTAGILAIAVGAMALIAAR
jgi:drug/metabolite transporter (DMT)-like permease